MPVVTFGDNGVPVYNCFSQRRCIAEDECCPKIIYLPVRSFTGMDRNEPDYRNGLPVWTFICVMKYFSFGF